MNLFARFWARLRHRPLALIGALVGVVIFAFSLVEAIEIRSRVVRVEANTPCLNLTTRDCAILLFNSLDEAERLEVGLRARQTLARAVRADLRQVRRLEELGRLRGRIPRDEPRRPGDDITAPEPGNPPSVQPDPIEPLPPQPPPPGQEPLLRVPPIETPPIGPIPPVRTPGLEIPCIPVPPIITCEGR